MTTVKLDQSNDEPVEMATYGGLHPAVDTMKAMKEEEESLGSRKILVRLRN